MKVFEDIHTDINILYVEDEEKIRNIVYKVLSKVFKNVEMASDGEEALKIFNQNNNFDIVVSDINMPKMNGIDLLRHIKKIDIDMPTALTTAHKENDFLFDAIDIGVDTYLVKPIDMTKLIKSISKTVEPRMLKKELENANTLLYNDLEKTTFQLNSIINTQDNFIAIINKNNISLLNSAFMEFLNIKSIKELEKNISSFGELLLEKNGYNFINSYDIIADISSAVNNYDNNFLINMKNKYNKEESFRLDLKTYEFDGLNYVLTFTSIDSFDDEDTIKQYDFNHDPITNLYTKEYYKRRFYDEINRYLRYGNNFCVSMIEIDDILELTSLLSYNEINKVLYTLSKIISSSLRETDVIARWDKERIIILHLETTSEQLIVKLEEVIEMVKDNKSLSYNNTQITISCGMSQFSFDDTSEAILKRVSKTLSLAHKINTSKLAVG